MSRKVDESNIKVQILLCLLVLSFYYLSSFLVSEIFYPETSNWIGFLVFFKRLFLNSIFAPLIFKLLDILTNRTEKWFGKANL